MKISLKDQTMERVRELHSLSVTLLNKSLPWVAKCTCSHITLHHVGCECYEDNLQTTIEDVDELCDQLITQIRSVQASLKKTKLTTSLGRG